MSSQFGATVIHEGEEPVSADVVFVHGLGGDSRGTWSKDGVMWPEELLPDRVPNARIITWGYDADPKSFLKQTGQQTVMAHAQELLQDLRDERHSEDEKSRPIVFVCHSLGALIVKQALCKADEYAKQHNRRTARDAVIGTCCAGIIFLGAIHRPGDQTLWATTASRLTNVMGTVDPDVLDSLKFGLTVVQGLQDSFASIQDRFTIHSMLETQPMRDGNKVLEESQATLGYPEEQIRSIPASHIEMSKYSTSKDVGFRRVAGAIEEQVEDAREVLAERAAKQLQSAAQGAQSPNATLSPTSTHTQTDGAAPGSHSRTPSVNAPSIVSSAPTQPPPQYEPRGDIKAPVVPVANVTTAMAALGLGAKPVVQPNMALITKASYKRLYDLLMAIEGPAPPEKYQRFIEFHKENKTWRCSAEEFKLVFIPDMFDADNVTSKSELLFLAAYVGDEEVARAALAGGANPEYNVPVLDDCPLNAAFCFDHSDIVEMLLSYGASFTAMVNKYNTGVQDYMIRHLPMASAKTVRIVLTHEGKDALPTYAPLVAAQSSSSDVVRLLGEFGFDMTIVSEKGTTVLHLAARHGRQDTVSYLIDVGFPVNCVDSLQQTPLYDAIINCKAGCVAVLLKNDAQVNIQDEAGDTPIHILVRNPKNAAGEVLDAEEIVDLKVDMLKLLLAAGAKLETMNNDGYRPLHVAINYSLGSMAAILLLAGADPEGKDKDGWTPLHLCANGKGEQVQIAAYLIEKGASLKARLPPPNSLTPLELAKKFANVTMVQLFNGARKERGVNKWFARRGIA